MDKLIHLLLWVALLLIPARADILFQNTSTSDQLIECPAAAGLEDIWSGGYEIWVRFSVSSGSHTGQQGLWVSRNGASGGTALAVRSDSTDFMQESHDTNGSTWFMQNSPDSSVPDDGSWHNYVHSWDGVISGTQYNGIDGVGYSGTTLISGSGTMDSDAGSLKTIGSIAAETAGGMNGTIKSMIVWDEDHSTSTASSASFTTRTMTTRQAMNFFPQDQVLCFEFFNGSEGQTEADVTTVTNLCPQNSGVASCTLRKGTWKAATRN